MTAPRAPVREMVLATVETLVPGDEMMGGDTVETVKPIAGGRIEVVILRAGMTRRPMRMTREPGFEFLVRVPRPEIAA